NPPALPGQLREFLSEIPHLRYPSCELERISARDVLEKITDGQVAFIAGSGRLIVRFRIKEMQIQQLRIALMTASDRQCGKETYRQNSGLPIARFVITTIRLSGAMLTEGFREPPPCRVFERVAHEQNAAVALPDSRQRFVFVDRTPCYAK